MSACEKMFAKIDLQTVKIYRNFKGEALGKREPLKGGGVICSFMISA